MYFFDNLQLHIIIKPNDWKFSILIYWEIRILYVLICILLELNCSACHAHFSYIFQSLSFCSTLQQIYFEYEPQCGPPATDFPLLYWSIYELSLICLLLPMSTRSQTLITLFSFVNKLFCYRCKYLLSLIDQRQHLPDW